MSGNASSLKKTTGTLSQRAYGEVKRRIREGLIKPGEVLRERALAVEAGISRTPLRAALLRIEKEGDLTRLGNGALILTDVTREQLLHITQIRRLLEGAAAGRAAERAQKLSDALACSRQKMQAYAQGFDAGFEQFWRDDGAFHQAVAQAAQLPLLEEMIGSMRLELYRGTRPHTISNYVQQAKEHLAVIDAIEAHDPQAAQAAMQRHFDGVRERILHQLARP